MKLKYLMRAGYLGSQVGHGNVLPAAMRLVYDGPKTSAPSRERKGMV